MESCILATISTNLCARHSQLLLCPCCSLPCFLLQSLSVHCNQRAQIRDRNACYLLWPAEHSYRSMACHSQQWIPYWFSKFHVFGPSCEEELRGLFSAHIYKSSFRMPFLWAIWSLPETSAMKILKFLPHLVWLAIFLNFQKHVNTFFHGPCLTIIHHSRVDKVSLINSVFQNSRSIILGTLMI